MEEPKFGSGYANTKTVQLKLHHQLATSTISPLAKDTYWQAAHDLDMPTGWIDLRGGVGIAERLRAWTRTPTTEMKN